MTIPGAHPVMFRAGSMTDTPLTIGPSVSATPRATGTSYPVTASPPVTLLADISEFQPDIADAAYLAWSKAIIIRCAYGTSHDDRAWYGGDRRDQLHAGGVRFLGIYAYLVAGQDPAAQADTVIRLTGTLRPGEKIICDLEEGTGNQHARWTAFRDRIRNGLGDSPWLYSGLNFAATHGLAPVEWVAAYQAAEPAVPHLLWQFTSSYAIPGIPGPADCSRYHGTIDQLAQLAWQPQRQQAFAAPTGLRAGKGKISLPLSWDPVTLNGKKPDSYTVTAYGMDGNRYRMMLSPGTTCVLDNLTAGWTYKIRVWANGGPVAPPHAEITVSL